MTEPTPDPTPAPAPAAPLLARAHAAYRAEVAQRQAETDRLNAERRARARAEAEERAAQLAACFQTLTGVAAPATILNPDSEWGGTPVVEYEGVRYYRHHGGAPALVVTRRCPRCQAWVDGNGTAVKSLADLGHALAVPLREHDCPDLAPDPAPDPAPTWDGADLRARATAALTAAEAEQAARAAAQAAELLAEAGQRLTVVLGRRFGLAVTATGPTVTVDGVTFALWFGNYKEADEAALEVPCPDCGAPALTEVVRTLADVGRQLAQPRLRKYAHRCQAAIPDASALPVETRFLNALRELVGEVAHPND